MHGLCGRDAVGFVEGLREVEFEDFAGGDEQRAPADGAFGFGGVGVEALNPRRDARGDAVPRNRRAVDG